MRDAGRAAVAFLVGCLTVLGSVSCASGSDDHPAYRPVGPPCNSSGLFAPDSVWNACLPADAPVDPDSNKLVAGLLAEVAREQRAGTGPYIQTDSYSTPLYIVRARQRGVRVALDEPGAAWRRGLQRALRRVPIPKGARPAAGSDAHLTIWQPARDSLWELWQAHRAGGRWHASWGGAIKGVSHSPGYFDSGSWPGLSRSSWGATATSLPVIGGTVLTGELRAGLIDHALALSLPAPRADVFAWPAQRTDGTGPADAIPEGARLRLDPGLDLESLHLPPVTLMLARAAQRYGMIVRDQTHAAIGLYAQDPGRGKRNPYAGRGGLFGGLTPTQLLAAFPWSSLEVARMRLCRGSSGCSQD